MIVDAAIRPDDWNLPLFLHVLGAMVTVGALALSATYLFAARGDGALRALRTGYRALLLAALPSFIVMRIAAQWVAEDEGVADSEAAWIEMGYAISDLGALLVIAATVAAGLGVRRAGRAEGSADGGRGRSIAAWLVVLLLVFYTVAIWAMATKPT